ncbi:hypothetical protein U1Q18_030924 [Sarracenia purpurea var. burkii]
MEKNGKDCNNVKKSSKSKPLVSVESEKVELNEGDEDNETKSLLPPPTTPRGGLMKKSAKPRRKVQWNDRNGNKLAEVLEFQPSDVSESDDESTDSCICSIL